VLELVQDTLFNMLLVPGVGLDSTDQVLPFHDSTRVWYWPPESTSVPTATHPVEVVHDTPNSPLSTAGLGLDTTDQALPFHDSTNVEEPLDTLPYVPTATQLDELMHDTPLRELSLLPGLGLDTTDQALPSQASTRVCCAPDALS
jgi:hypothetical protein